MTGLPRTLFMPVRGRPARYGVAIALFLFGFGVRYAFDTMFPQGFPFLTFFPVVILSTFLAGRWPGALCGVLSGLAALYFFIPPRHTFLLDGQRATAMGFYAFVVVVDVMLIDGLMRRQRQLEESEARLAAMSDYQALLFKELQHRVANNLASVASMLRLKRRQIERDPSLALEMIDRADARIELMGRIHRQLYDPLAREMSVHDQIEQVVLQTREVTAKGPVACDIRIAPIPLETGRLMTLVLLISEILTNSFKHAFDGREDARVLVELAEDGPAHLRLTVADNGKGLGEAPAGAAARGLGTAIIRGFVSQLNGRMTVDGKDGVTTVVTFPAC